MAGHLGSRLSQSEISALGLADRCMEPAPEHLWFCSLPTGHGNEHAAYESHVIQASCLRYQWTAMHMIVEDDELAIADQTLKSLA